MASPRYIMQPDLDKALSAFTGYIDHTISMAKADIRRELIESEDRLRSEIQASETRVQAEIQASEARLQTQIDEMRAEFKEMKQQLDRVETVGKNNHQMFQIMLEQMSKITKKLGTD